MIKSPVYNTNISEIENKITGDLDHNKYVTCQEFDKLTGKNSASRLAKKIYLEKMYCQLRKKERF